MRIPTLASLAVAATTALAPGARADATSDSLLDALSFISGRLLAPPISAPVVTQDGAQFRVRVPLPGNVAPKGAAVEIGARQSDGGTWEINGLTFPPKLVIALPESDDGKKPEIDLSIGKQEGRGRVDASLAQPSSYSFAFRDIALTAQDGGPHVEGQAHPVEAKIGSLASAATIVGAPGNRSTTRSTGSLESLSLTVSEDGDTQADISLDSVSVSYDVIGLDRARAQAMGQLAQQIPSAQQPQGGAKKKPTVDLKGKKADLPPDQRRLLLAMLDGSAGLMTGFNLEETFKGLQVEAKGETGGFGEVRLAVAGEENDAGIAARFDMSVQDLSLSVLPPEYAAYLPKTAMVRTAFSGINGTDLRSFFRDSLANDIDQAVAQEKALALLNGPQAHLGIEALQVESGPMQVQGNAAVKNLPDGTPAVEMHLTARGIDQMLALLQADPSAQQIIPVLFLAKGMGRQEGDHVVWDITFAHGAFTVNGVPLGQPAPPPKGQRPPAGKGTPLPSK